MRRPNVGAGVAAIVLMLVVGAWFYVLAYALFGR